MLRQMYGSVEVREQLVLRANPSVGRILLLQKVIISRVGKIEVHATQGTLVLGSLLTALSALRWGGRLGLAATVLILASLLLHELGHLLMAQAFGVRVKAIGLCLKGAYLRRSDSRQAGYELLIALAGPAANLLLYVWLRDGGSVLRWVAILNLVLAISNLIPFPGSDGARICQSLQSLTSNKSGDGEVATSPSLLRHKK